MSEKDLTRWNRSGLSRLNYVNGNAATFLEEIRAALEQRFTGSWQGKLDPPETGSDLEDDEEWIQQATNTFLIEQYRGERGDIGWELARAFVRSCHVLTGHLNAHANETFLRTATQWDYIRKMVAMLDYHPAGATSAKTLLAIKVREKRKGIIKKGLQVRHRPLSGGKPIVFENLEDLDADWEFNEFRVDGHDQSQKKLSKAEEEAGNAEGIFDIKKSPWTANPKAPVVINDSVIIIKDKGESAAEAARVLDKKGNRIKLGHEGYNWKIWTVGEARLKSSPRFKRKPWINGKSVRRATVPHGISEGSIISWRKVGETDKYAWRFAEIERADSMGLELVIDEKFKKFLDENGNPAYNSKGYSADDIWPDWSIDDIEVRRATKLTDSFTVPAGSEAEKRIGDLANFTSANMVSSGGNINDDDKVFRLYKFEDGKIADPELDTSVDQDQDFMNFIKWLFNASGFIASFPPSPDIIVKIGALLMLKDARIPSTGQLVFEAFLDIFGGNGDQKDYTKPSDDQQGTIPALFRFWIEKEEEETEWNEARPSGRPPLGIKGELWYLQEKKEGGGHVEGDIKTFTLKNQHDNCWFFFNGKPTGIKVGDWAAAKFGDPLDNDVWYAVQIKKIDISKPRLEEFDGQNESPGNYTRKNMSWFAVELELPQAIKDLSEIPEMVEFQADFRHEGEPVGADINEAVLGNSIKLTPCPKNLPVGRTLLAVNDNGETLKVRVESFYPETCALIFKPSLPDSFNQGNLKLFGNVVLAGHGERRPAVSLGAGVGVQRQNFLILDKTEVSTVPDKRMAGGAREDLAVHIGDEQWRQVANFDHSEPTDPHFTVTTTEEGFLKLQFGDDRQGRTLPAGTNNVRVDYRVGAGRRGSVSAGSLEKLLQPHPLVESVGQPFEANGGEDMDPPEHMRERAPASLLALERAVSISDFEQLAMQHRAVWQARAFYYIGAAGLRDKVEVVVALAEGKTLVDENLNEEITDYLQQRAVPTVQVVVESYDPIAIYVKINFRLNLTIYEESQVVTDVKKALVEAFSVERRRINQSLHLSEIYAVVEKVPGVENSTCAFLDDDLEPTEQQLILSGTKKIVFIANEDALTCVHREYQP